MLSIKYGLDTQIDTKERQFKASNRCDMNIDLEYPAMVAERDKVLFMKRSQLESGSRLLIITNEFAILLS